MRTLIVFLMSSVVFCVSTLAKSPKTKVQWVSFEQLDSLMKVQPKKILMDIYTDWCGYCKSMDKDIYENEAAANYINTHFYAVKLNAEQKDSINFNGQIYPSKIMGKKKYQQELAFTLLKGFMFYPSTILFDEQMQIIRKESGYIAIIQMESMLKYYATNSYKKQPENEFLRSIRYEWRPG